jgi:O-antigen ligase
MRVLRIRDPDAIRPLHVVLICLVTMTLAGSLLLLSAAKPTAPVDGAIEWHTESPLRAVVELLCLNYQVPTYYAGAIKNFILGIGAGLAMIVLSLAITAQPRTTDETSDLDDAALAFPASGDSATPKTHVAPLVAAQVLVVLYLLWSFASSRWSLAPELAVGGSILLTIQFLWAFGLGNGLSPSASRLASHVMVVVTAVTAAVAIWYHYGRNPTLRADFPVGNPDFLGACLIPGILLGGALVWEKTVSGGAARRGRLVGLAVPAAAATVLCLWALLLADSRGSYIGLLFGLLALLFFALRGRMRLVPVGTAILVALIGWGYLYAMADASSPTGRSATLRLRPYAWSYALRMFNEDPFKGHGQGGFVLAGDSYVSEDVLADPLVFESRIAHAHNEWLEVMADLGSVGIVLVVAVLLLTLRGGMAALAGPLPPARRWMLLGLMGSLVGLVVEEAFSVGLRVAAVGTMFYTVIGLIWALSGQSTTGLAHRLSATRGRRMMTGVVGGLVGVVVLVFNQQDFAAARNVYEADKTFRDGDYEEAIRLASLTTSRLNPQRALTNFYRLSEAHLREAEHLHHRARDRARRAHEKDPPDARLSAMAREDFRLSEQHCEKGSAALKELVVRSPGFINHGRLDYRLNLTRAANAAARGDLEGREPLRQAAVAAIRRELRRQPFNPSISIDYARVTDPLVDPAEFMEVLARPLRHHRVNNAYMDLLRELAANPEFDRLAEPIWQGAQRAAASPPIDERSGKNLEVWAPEKLRLAAAIHFIRGDYAAASERLNLAAAAYQQLAASPFGAASCYGELAICQFFHDPGDPAPALASARRAIALAPRSRQGRELKLSLRQRMIEFHLAGNQEQEAKRLLKATAPPGVTEADLLNELGRRYLRLCESLLERREAGGVLRKPPADVAPKLQRWVARAIELNADDPAAYFLAADLAFYVGDDEATAAHVQKALERGLPIESARRFLQLAREQEPDSAPLASLWRALFGTEASRKGIRKPPPPIQGRTGKDPGR